MARQLANLGTAPKGQDGDAQRTANIKFNGMFQELYTADGTKTTAAVAQASADAAQGTATAAANAAAAAQATASDALPKANAAALALAINITYRNKLINGAFDFNQRGSGTYTVTSTYTADRWLMQFGAGVAFNVTPTSLGTINPVPAKVLSANYLDCNVVTATDAANSYALIQQRVEDVRTLAGRTATISGWLYAVAATSIVVALLQNFGAGGSAAINPISPTKVNLATGWNYLNVQIPVPAITGKTTGAGSYLGLNVWLSAGSAQSALVGGLITNKACRVYLYQMQLEEGTVPTSFEELPPEKILALCQRYFEKSYNTGVAPGTSTGDGRLAYAFSAAKGGLMWVSTLFKVTKRVPPTVTIWNVGATVVGGAITQASGTAKGATLNAVNSSAFELSWTNDAADYGGFFQYAADAEL